MTATASWPKQGVSKIRSFVENSGLFSRNPAGAAI